ncbi:MAG: hypothetical protein M3M97_02040 [Actinomycetota bacterium]|nr:hypothetical protein [Actinomycetota bacterium]
MIYHRRGDAIISRRAHSDNQDGTPFVQRSFRRLPHVGAAASIWGTLGFFAKILYAEGVSFEALVAVRASVGWAAMLLFVVLTRGYQA